ncbi:hypothetical protein D3C71_2150810 [compost metagenome]
MSHAGVSNEAHSCAHCRIYRRLMLADTCIIVTVCRDNQQPVHTGKCRVECLRLIEITMADVNA